MQFIRRRFSKSQFLDPAGSFTLVLRCFPQRSTATSQLTGHVAVPNRSILR